MSRNKRDLLRKGGLFVPLIFSFGATCEDLPLEVFLDDPTKISNSLRTINSFFKTDGTVCCGSDRMLAEAIRSSASVDAGTFMDPAEKESLTWVDSAIKGLVNVGRPAVILEVAKRLGMLMPDSLLFAVVAGPLKLATQLTGLGVQELLSFPNFLNVTTKALLTFLRAMGETGVDMVAIREDGMAPVEPKFSMALNRCYSPLWNTAKFYGMKALLMPEQVLPENAMLYKKMVDNIIFPADTYTETLVKFKKPSFSIPIGLLERDPGEIESFLTEKEIVSALESKKLFLLTTDQEISGSIDKERMIRGIQNIRNVLNEHEK